MSTLLAIPWEAREDLALDDDVCYAALVARDARFDGVFFVGVTTTGIYCRPVCTARVPGRARCTFHPSAALAERAGFRACFRCRPELAPGGGAAGARERAGTVGALDGLVQAAVARIEAGALNEGSLAELAAELGVTDRHLRRAVQARLGVSPVELAQSRRLALAKRLLHDTRLTLAEVAHASGFGSVRRFNALFQSRFRRPPTALRRQLRETVAAGHDPSPAVASSADGWLELRLDYRPPLQWRALLGFIAARAIPGVEAVVDGEYRRALRLGERRGQVRVRPHPRPGRAALVARVSPSLVGALMPLVARLRHLFDLDAHPGAIDAALARDRRLGPSVRRHPGLRVPGTLDGFEMAVRAVLGQQVSVRAATTLAGRLAAALGEPLDATFDAQLPQRLFPTAARVAGAALEDLTGLGLTRARAATVHALARAVAGGELRLDGVGALEPVLERLMALPGIGPWTAQVVAMRALRWPDAFPAGDLGLKKGAAGLSAAGLAERAAAWRPWRAYAVMHLWTSSDVEARSSASSGATIEER
jgi:AraC family transcriptional regulator of adaptative response / DNA-3-methyladenine glycosylase II